VVGLNIADTIISQDAFRYLQKNLNAEKKNDPLSSMRGVVDMVGNMEVAFAQGSLELAKAKYVQKNVPKATVTGLYHAFQIAEKDKVERAQDETEYLATWLGTRRDPSYWKYVYLTEPDCILQTRPSSLHQLRMEVDKGVVLVPQRLQPIPHESDARGSSLEHTYLPQNFAPVLELDPIGEHDVCCDAWEGHDTKPGLPPLIENCGNFWYLCDFFIGKYKQEGAHRRLKPYALMRLKTGTRIVSLTASEHGRPCSPHKRAVCPPKTW
jgi:hypothetical protein